MDRAQQLSEFLKTRRARLRPDDVGAGNFGGQRRVPGLRREELALLAGVSVDYYTRLEQGRARNASADVLDAVASALRLDADERTHLHNLAKPTSIRRRPSRPQQVGPEMRQALQALATIPAYIIGRRLDAGRHPDDPQLATLVGELSLGSVDFRRLWADHNVRGKTRGRKRFNHPQLGELALDYVAMRAPDDPDMTMMIYSTPPGSEAATTLQLLASLTTPPVPDTADLPAESTL